MKNVLLVSLCRAGDPSQWIFVQTSHIDLTSPRFREATEQMRADYIAISDKMRHDIEHGRDRYIHTSNGAMIQIRTKDSRPYHPLYSKFYKRQVSNKNYAFYLKRPGIVRLMNTASEDF